MTRWISLPAVVGLSLLLASGAWALGMWSSYEGPVFKIVMDDAGYSCTLYNIPCDRNILSGDWAAAIHYAGIEEYTGGVYAMWLTDRFCGDCRPGMTNSNFIVNFSGVDMICGTSVSEIKNDEVEIQIQYFMDCEARTPMGVCPYVCSRQQVLLQRYLIRNISPNPLYDVTFFQMLIGHPMCSEWGDWGVFDPTPYTNTTCPFYEDYRFDITLWGDAYNPDVCWEYMNFATHGPFHPEFGNAWDVDECLSIIQKVENDALANPPECQPVGPDFLGGALKWTIGTMDQTQEVVIDVLLTIGFQECCPTDVESEFGERTTWGCIKSLYR